MKLLYTLRERSSDPTRFELDVWIEGREGGYDYIGMITDDVLVIAVDPTSIFNRLEETYTIKDFGRPKFTLDVTTHRLRWALLLGG